MNRVQISDLTEAEKELIFSQKLLSTFEGQKIKKVIDRFLTSNVRNSLYSGLESQLLQNQSSLKNTVQVDLRTKNSLSAQRLESKRHSPDVTMK